jgi:hypothetical protein
MSSPAEYEPAPSKAEDSRPAAAPAPEPFAPTPAQPAAAMPETAEVRHDAAAMPETAEIGQDAVTPAATPVREEPALAVPVLASPEIHVQAPPRALQPPPVRQAPSPAEAPAPAPVRPVFVPIRVADPAAEALGRPSAEDYPQAPVRSPEQPAARQAPAPAEAAPPPAPVRSAFAPFRVADPAAEALGRSPAEDYPEPVLHAPVPAPVPVPAATVREVTDPKQASVPSIERALSGPSRDRTATGSWGGKVKIVTGNGAAQGPGARDQEAQDRNRARLPIAEPRRILVLGCTSGAGQSVTALMTASMLASLREHPVAAVDLHDGTLARYRAPAAWLEELLAGKPPQLIRPTRPDGLHPSPKPNPARLDVVASHEPLGDGDEIKLAVQLNRHYPLTLLDPGAAGLTRLLKVADQLVVVVPANADAAGALADTRDWLDNNGHADLAMQSVTVINGVSRRSLPDVENAESIARGRSRAIVRVPWDDMLPVAAANPSTLRPQTRVAYTALAGVLVAGLAAAPARKKS